MAEPIKAGAYPAELLAACAAQGVDPGELMSWAVRKDEVQLIMPNGQKVRLALAGAWSQPRPAAAKSQPGKSHK